MIGYSESRKGYQLHDVENRKIVHSRDVTFNELTSGFEESQGEIEKTSCED